MTATLQHPRAASPAPADHTTAASLSPAVDGEALVAAGPSADRRGPLRPGRLVAARRRLRGELVAYAFCGLDGLGLMLVAAVAYFGAFAGLSGVAALWAAAPLAATALLCLVGQRLAGAYDFRARERAAAHLIRVGLALAGTALLLASVLILAHAPQPLPAALAAQLGLSALGLLASHLTWRALVARWRRRGLLTPNVVVVGANANARSLIERVMLSGELAVLGVFDDRHARAPKTIAGVPVLGDTQALVGHRIMPFVDRVVIAVDPSAKSRINAIIERLAVLPNDISLIVDMSPTGSPDATLDRLVDAPLSRISGRRGGYRRMVAKRAQDLVLGLLALALAAPVMLIVAVAIKLEGPGPIFFRQRRDGFNNELIVVWKFRSMTHALRDERAEQQVKAGDARVTRVGRLIRSTSLDELPQLFNVLAGEMSLVGPRPHAPNMKTGEVQSAKLVAHYAHRHKMKPGMTGWAAIHGSRGPLDSPEAVRRRVELDMAYIERQSFWLDLRIMLMTLPCLLGDRLNAR